MTPDRSGHRPADQSVTYRQLAGGELDTAGALLATYLPGSSLRDLLGGESRVFGAFERGGLVACLHWSLTAASWSGRTVTIGRIGPGATVPGQRRRGMMRTLLHRVLRQMRDAGVSLAGQETPVIGYHRRTGWEVATFARRHVADRSAVLSLNADSYACRPAGPGDAPAVHAVWAAHVRARRFVPVRGPEHWRSSLAVGSWWVALDAAGRVGGYAFAEGGEQADGDRLGDVGTGRIGELVAVEVPAARALLCAVTRAVPAGLIEWWTAPDDDSHFVFPDARVVAVTDEVDKLLRVVDAAAVLEGLAPDLVGDPFEVAVRDDVCEWNNQTIAVTPGRGAYAVGPMAADLHLDVRALAALASGAIGPAALAAAGLIEPQDAPVLHRLAAPGARLAPWHPDPL